MLALLTGLPFVSSIIANLRMVAICAAVLVSTNAVSGVVWYVKGHNAAAAKCQIGTLKRELAEKQRDLNNATSTSTFLNKKLKELQDKQDARDDRNNDVTSKLKPVNGCTVPVLPAARRVRGNGVQR